MKAGTFISVISVSLAVASGALAQSPAVPPAAAEQQQPQTHAAVADQPEAPAQASVTTDAVQALHTALRSRLADLRH